MSNRMKFETWVDGLQFQKVAALACQVGITCHMSRPIAKMRRMLYTNERALEIYEQTYGKEAKVPG